MMRVLYLAHDLDDPAVWRRVEMLRLGGAEVILAGFRRGSGALPEPALVLGQTHNARMGQRVLAILRQRLKLHATFADLPRPDVILCRNLEMLALAVPLHRRLQNDTRISLVYEVLDIHRLLIGRTWKARSLRWIERQLCQRIDNLIVSSPAFLRAYFEAYGQCTASALLVENKVLLTSAPSAETGQKPSDFAPSRPLRIGWFGILRCPFSLDCLDRLTRARPGRYRITLRGRPALDALPDFHTIVDANPDMSFGGGYTYPDDLAGMYGEVDLAWLVDQYDTGSNSNWLLPNRLYESGMNQVPPIALDGTEIATRLRELGIGVILEKANVAIVTDALAALDPDAIGRLRQAQIAVAPQTWMVSEQDARALVNRIAPDRQKYQHHLDQSGILIVVPTLNEAAHIGQVMDGLAPFLARRQKDAAPTRLVVVDGGSTDGTPDIVKDRISALSQFDILLLNNPARLQSAGINLAVATFGAGFEWLVRLDAHSDYPEDYVDVLLTEACRTGAVSVVVSMTAVGSTPMQHAIAVTQNSRLGNGGSAHRSGTAGRFVDHGHHALIRLDAFRSVGGYDGSFSHNEDAELDLRLARDRYRIWLTSETHLDYVPRKTIAALVRQYFQFGRGRARTTLKHGIMPRLRQIAMISVAPLAGLVALTPVSPVFGIPAAIWLMACLIAAAKLSLTRRDPLALSAAPIAAAMHLAWSAGFWRQLFVKQGASTPIALPPSTQIPVTGFTDHVAVGVCTYQRPVLIDTLRSLENQVLPDGLRLSIIVVDNDTAPSARDIVDKFAAQSRHSVVYRHAPAANISIARNTALKEADRQKLPIFAFIDDDELAPANWLNLLVTRLAQGDADVVVGPVRASYPPGTPGWMQRLRIHDTIPEIGANGRPIAGHSCNVIMDLASAPLKGRRFDLDRGVSGGEDTAFFKDAVADGALLAFAPNAWLNETVTQSRARFSWLFKRRFRMGQTHGSLLRGQKGSRGRLVRLPIACAKVVYCALFAVLASPFPAVRNANLLRGALHLGTIASLIGFRHVVIYGQGAGTADQATSA
ncbi:glycosyltransferase [Sulfitobacter sp. SK011]|uniref:glycosyltransferase n=1 Tax=Sulfitobacter sp. SK011 TaxID=1389004 RepID=UPI0020C75A4C|nr:glycosyltransferase [Sulfitobacter sp. SK011]